MPPDDWVPLDAPPCDGPPTFDAAPCDDPAWVLPGTPDAVLADGRAAVDALTPDFWDDPPCAGAPDAKPPPTTRCVPVLLAEFPVAALPLAKFPAG